MLYKNYLFILIFFIFTNCSTNNLKEDKPNLIIKKSYKNKGFALIYNENLYNNKIISNKIEERSLIIFQRNLKKDTQVKITNILNNKSLIVKVGKKSNYPSFNNSVVSIRVADELNLDKNEPYVKIMAISDNSLFIAKKAKTYDEEKTVANKVPVNTISIYDLNENKIKNKNLLTKKFSYIIKIVDFYFYDTAQIMLTRINTETKVKKTRIKKISDKVYRVYLGPFDNINSLKKSFNDISILEFENIEIIRND